MSNAIGTASAFLLGLALLVPAACQAQTRCPWMNEATAEGILGGDAIALVKVNDGGGGVCQYSRHHGAAAYELHITVDIMTDVLKQFPAYLAQCPGKTTELRAIGNKAVVCSIQSQEKHYAEKVVGRVRNQAFVVSVSSTVPEDPSMTEEMRREKCRLVAEQVAGSLF